MKLERYQIYGIIGAILLFVSLLWPKIYNKHDYIRMINAGRIENIYKLKGFVRKWTEIGKKIPPFVIKAGNKVIVPQGVPLWRIIITSPLYPKSTYPNGLDVDIMINGPHNACKVTDCLHEINTLNHYIGMSPLSSAAPVFSRLGSYLALLMFFMVLVFIFVKKKVLGWFVILPIITPLLFLLIFTYWTHWLGFNLDPWASYKVHSFTPVLYGIGKITVYTTHNRPGYGFTLMVLASIFLFLAYLSKKKYVESAEKVNEVSVSGADSTHVTATSG